jgi:hypothetical protein
MRTLISPGRAAQVGAVLLGTTVLALWPATVVLDSVTHYPGTGGPVFDALAYGAGLLPAAAVATLLAARRPGNPIGWLLFGVIYTGNTPTQDYIVLDYRTHHGTLPLGWAAVVLQDCWPLFLLSISILLWVFPDGKLPGGRWRRPATVLLVAGIALAVTASVPGVLIAVRGHIRLTASGDLAGAPGGAFLVLYGAVIAMAVLSWLAWLGVQIPAYRRADGERRQQLKWLYSGGGICLVALIFGVYLIPLAMGQVAGWGTSPVVTVLLVLAFGALPACLGVAVLKYRLYELDRIISRVVSYSLITALLVGVYTGLVLLATHVLPVRSAVAVAASTLITAALFNPLRRRVQRAVDRRFNRSRYNAEAVVAAFTARLRHTVDFDAVRDDLVGVVDEAFEPTAVSVWLAPPRLHSPGYSLTPWVLSSSGIQSSWMVMP